MKTINLFIIGLLFFGASTIHAQVSVDVNIGTPNVNVHVGTPPVWGPVGYDNVEYYYLPDIQVYYDIRLTQYIYFGNGKWVRSKYLPRYCRNYDLYHGYKVVLADYHGNAPYTDFNTHKVKYYKGYKGEPQKMRGPYQVHYENHEHHDNGHHNGHKGKGNNEKSKGGKH